jgi:hypothetical protein
LPSDGYLAVRMSLFNATTRTVISNGAHQEIDLNDTH